MTYDDEVHFTETETFRIYSNKVEAIVHQADKDGGDNYRGITIGAIHRQLGTEHRDWTPAALRGIEGLITIDLIPARYTFKDTRVKHLPIPPGPVTPVFGYRLRDTKAKPVRDFGTFSI